MVPVGCGPTTIPMVGFGGTGQLGTWQHVGSLGSGTSKQSCGILLNTAHLDWIINVQLFYSITRNLNHSCAFPV